MTFTTRKELAESLSARRAWIEIGEMVKQFDGVLVALRKESVDRNKPVGAILLLLGCVALRKESVDRNTDFQFWSPPLQRRSPQGERG